VRICRWVASDSTGLDRWQDIFDVTNCDGVKRNKQAKLHNLHSLPNADAVIILRQVKLTSRRTHVGIRNAYKVLPRDLK
jgi:hypothetical protein